MKTLFCSFLVSSLMICIVVHAQDSAKERMLDFQTPPSPAFVLLGIEPTSIDEPTTPRAVAASFITSIRQGGALEVAPYWLTSHPKLTFDDYYKAGIGQTILQTLSFSFATLPQNDLTDSLGTRLGLGARWMFAAGEPRDTLNILKMKLKEVHLKILDTEDSTEIARLKSEARIIALAIQREDKMRIGFRLQMASAVSMNFVGNNVSKGTFDRWGIWLTGAYQWNEPKIDFLTVARLMGNHKTYGTQNVLDLGLRLVSLLDDFSLSIEYIYRTEINTSGKTQASGGISDVFFLKNTYRLAGNIEYKYNKDISAYLTFGRNYSSANTKNDPLVAQVGINLGFGEIPVLNSSPR